jgi:oligoribonuclease NrnB/cAMP/cGMP phosphodiesterase (DHH superfamily)
MSKELVPLVIYHGNCQDGFTAAWACWKAHPDWEFYPATYGKLPPDVTGRKVYMLDFSYKRPVLETMALQADSILILDHHKSAELDLQPFLPINLTVKFDMEKSGARLAWEYFHPGTQIPLLVKYVEDRDLWKFSMEDTKEITAWLFSQNYGFDIWDMATGMINYSHNEAWMAGDAILQKQAKDVAELCEKKFRYIIGGHNIWCVNVPYTLASDCGVLLGKDEPFAASVYYDGEGVVFSLRSDDKGLDVSEIAKQYGGGGHKHAAGFKLKSPLLLIDPKKVGLE